MIVYKNNDYVIVNKPAGLDSEHQLKELLEKELGTVVYPVHRLDKAVTGLIVYALNEKTAALLSRQIQEKSFEKEYLLICEGAFDDNEGEMKDLLYHDRQRNKSYVAAKKRAGVKEALLEYRVLKTSESDGSVLSLVRVHLHTGRTHQIRVQFGSRQHPLLGDRTYGSKLSFPAIALHSCYLSFTYRKERVVYELDPESEDWKEYGYQRTERAA